MLASTFSKDPESGEGPAHNTGPLSEEAQCHHNQYSMEDSTMSQKTLHSHSLAALLIVFFAATASMGILGLPNLIHAEDT